MGRRPEDLETEIEAIVDALIPRLTRASAFDDIMLFAHEALASQSSARQPSVATTSVLLGETGYISASDLGSAYRDSEREEQSLVTTRSDGRSAPEFTARMLEGLSPQALRALRRRLAATHHPDLALEGANEGADNRMSEINEMIDAALREAMRRSGN